jgi:hypothetical protein
MSMMMVAEKPSQAGRWRLLLKRQEECGRIAPKGVRNAVVVHPLGKQVNTYASWLRRWHVSTRDPWIVSWLSNNTEEEEG